MSLAQEPWAAGPAALVALEGQDMTGDGANVGAEETAQAVSFLWIVEV
jgi:hypothetical protein